LSTQSSPDMSEVKTKPTDQAAADFWGPLIHVVNLVELIVKVHIILAALLFPQFFTNETSDQPEPSSSYKLWCLAFSGIIFLINFGAVFAIISYLVKGEMIQFAKAIFVFIAWTVSIFALIVVNHEKTINSLLFAVEEEALHTRDESVMLIRAGQAGLRSLSNKFYGEESPDQFFTASELIKSIGPLALLFLNKERNILRWGMVGAKVAAKGIRFMQDFARQK
jgi:phosphate starvation-inducible membrane PsiE